MSQEDASTELKFVLPDAEATRKLGIVLGERLPAGSAILLEGSLGAGKTTLVQGLAQGLAISEWVDSPTFTLINEYGGGTVATLSFRSLSPSARGKCGPTAGVVLGRPGDAPRSFGD